MTEQMYFEAVAARDAEIVKLRGQRDALAEAIGVAAVRLGIYDGRPLTGPEVIAVLGDVEKVAMSAVTRDDALTKAIEGAVVRHNIYHDRPLTGPEVIAVLEAEVVRKGAEITRRVGLLGRLLGTTAAYALPDENCVDTAIRLLDAGPIAALAGVSNVARHAVDAEVAKLQDALLWACDTLEQAADGIEADHGDIDGESTEVREEVERLRALAGLDRKPLKMWRVGEHHVVAVEARNATNFCKVGCYDASETPVEVTEDPLTIGATTKSLADWLATESVGVVSTETAAQRIGRPVPPSPPLVAILRNLACALEESIDEKASHIGEARDCIVLEAAIGRALAADRAESVAHAKRVLTRYGGRGGEALAHDAQRAHHEAKDAKFLMWAAVHEIEAAQPPSAPSPTSSGDEIRAAAYATAWLAQHNAEHFFAGADAYVTAWRAQHDAEHFFAGADAQYSVEDTAVAVIALRVAAKTRHDFAVRAMFDAMGVSASFRSAVLARAVLPQTIG